MKKITGVVVLICDGVPDSNGEIVQREGVEIADYGDAFPEPQTVPLTHQFDPRKPLGRARLYWDGPRLLADLEIVEDNDIPPLEEK